MSNMHASAAAGTPVAMPVEEMHAEVQATVRRISILQRQLAREKRNLVKSQTASIPLPEGMVLAWEADLPSQCSEWTEDETGDTFPHRRAAKLTRCDHCEVFYNFKKVTYSNGEVVDVESKSCPSCGASGSLADSESD